MPLMQTIAENRGRSGFVLAKLLGWFVLGIGLCAVLACAWFLVALIFIELAK